MRVFVAFHISGDTDLLTQDALVSCPVGGVWSVRPSVCVTNHSTPPRHVTVIGSHVLPDTTDNMHFSQTDKWQVLKSASILYHDYA